MEFDLYFLDNYYSLKNNDCMYSIKHGLGRKKAYVTLVAMATMTFQNGGYIFSF